MSDSQSADREEELAKTAIGQEPEKSDSTEPASVPAHELEELIPDEQTGEQATAEGEVEGNMQAEMEGLQAEQSQELQQDVEGQRAEGTLSFQDGSSVQQEAPPDSIGAEDEAAEYVSASIDRVVETNEDAEPAEVLAGSTAFQSVTAADAPLSLTDTELFSSNTAGWQPSAQQQLIPGALASALANPELDPDHPLLARAQKALSKQLLAIKDRLEAEVREKAVALQVCQDPWPQLHLLKSA